ncbi:MAG: hypothetical protein ACR2QT_13315 [Woeseiaceae bacterium]
MSIVNWNAALLMCLGLLVSCKSSHYELDMQVDGDKMQRQLSVWMDPSSNSESEFGVFPTEDLSPIAAAYQTDLPEDLAARHEFAGSFGPLMPADIGGSGWLLAWPTSLGTTYIYSEQFRGNDAIHAGLHRRLKTSHRIIDTIIVWLESEFSESDDLQQIVTGFDTTLRADLLDLTAYDWVDATVTAEEFGSENLLFRFAQYFANRGYFDPLRIPEYYRIIFKAENTDDMQPGLDIVARGLATRLGFSSDAPLPIPFQALVDDWPRYEESLSQFIETSEQISALEEAWAVEDNTQNSADRITAKDLLEDTYIFGIDLGIWDYTTPEKLTAVLHVSSEPLETNGEWNEESATIEWQMTLASNKEPTTQVPNSLFAMWVSPAVDFQLEHFGSIAISDELFVEYCLWRNGLIPSHAEQWDAFLESLIPDPDLDEEISAFRFEDEPDIDEANEHLYEVIGQLAEKL